MEEKKKKRETFLITSNIVQKRKLFDKIPYRNIFEGLVLSGIVILFIYVMPFVEKFKIVSSIIYFIVIMVFCCNGLYGRCISETLFDYIKFRRNRKKLHLGDMNDEQKYSGKSKRSGNQSYAEKAFSFVKAK